MIITRAWKKRIRPPQQIPYLSPSREDFQQQVCQHTTSDILNVMLYFLLNEMSSEKKVGKLQFKKSLKPASGMVSIIVIYFNQPKKMTNHLNQNLLSKRRYQDVGNNSNILDRNEDANEQDLATKEKEEILAPEQIIKKIKVGKTAAQVSYDMIKMKRIEERIEKQLELTYREKVDEFNRRIAKMPEHYDIPKVGPG